MKRGFRTVAALSFIALLVPALAFALPVRLGFAVGPSLANMPGADSPMVDFKSVKSFTAGVDVRVPLKGAFEIQTGAGYVVKGLSFGESRLTDDGGNVKGTVETLLASKQVEVPVLLRWNPPVHFALQPYLLAGPFASVKLDEALRNTGDDTTAQKTSHLPSSDFGFVGSAGVAMKLGPGHATLAVRYEGGLKDLGYLSTSSVRSGLFAVTTGYGF